VTALGDLTGPEAERLAAAGARLAVSVGSTEQHGPLLPLSTDTDVAVAQAVRLAIGGFLAEVGIAGLDLQRQQPARGLMRAIEGLSVRIDPVVLDVLAAKRPAPPAELHLGCSDAHVLGIRWCRRAHLHHQPEVATCAGLVGRPAVNF
jgi:Creatinine amidohydrolase